MNGFVRDPGATSATGRSSAYSRERVLSVHHWNEFLFSFTTTRDPGFRFESGQFVMVGLEVDGRPLVRAYSIASAAWEEHLEFFSIVVPDGPLTSRLVHVKPGDEVLVSRKPTGTLLLHDLTPAPNLYLFATGTGLAPFLSLVRDPEAYERFEKIVVVHGVRNVSDLAYRELLERGLREHEYLGEMAKRQLVYHPSVTREDFPTRGRIPELIARGEFGASIGLPDLSPATDRAMLCGSPQMLADVAALLDARGFRASRRIGDPGDYVIERAFVER